MIMSTTHSIKKSKKKSCFSCRHYRAIDIDIKEAPPEFAVSVDQAFIP